MKNIKTRISFEVDFEVNDDTDSDEMLQLSEDLIITEIPDGWMLDEDENFSIKIISSEIISDE